MLLILRLIRRGLLLLAFCWGGWYVTFCPFVLLYVSMCSLSLDFVPCDELCPKTGELGCLDCVTIGQDGRPYIEIVPGARVLF